MNNPEVLDIVLMFLGNNDYDGLGNSNCGCACLKSDIAPCGEINGDCRAGYKKLCTDECDHEGYDSSDPKCWHIQLEAVK